MRSNQPHARLSHSPEILTHPTSIVTQNPQSEISPLEQKARTVNASGINGTALVHDRTVGTWRRSARGTSLARGGARELRRARRACAGGACARMTCERRRARGGNERPLQTRRRRQAGPAAPRPATPRHTPPPTANAPPATYPSAVHLSCPLPTAHCPSHGSTDVFTKI